VHVSLPTEEHEAARLSLYFSTFLPTIERFSRKTAKSGGGLHQFGLQVAYAVTNQTLPPISIFGRTAAEAFAAPGVFATA
jgi:hypothetical protein